MGLINAQVALLNIQSYRLVWIAGRTGGHKTSVAYKLAQPFLERGYRLITNNRCAWADDMEKVDLLDNGMLKAVVVLDEGGRYFKANQQIEMLASYPAKMDLIYLFPSFWPPTKAARLMTIQPIFNLLSAGIPVVVYKWRVRIEGFEDKGTFLWWQPKEIYGIYSRQDPSEHAQGIIAYLQEKTEKYVTRFGRERGNIISEMEATSESASFTDAVESLSQFGDDLKAISIRKSGRRRF